jgi:predicted DNA-binding protein
MGGDIMLPRKTGKPIAFKCTEEFREETEAIADSKGITVSDYVRQAVEYYNAQHKGFDSTHNTVSKPDYTNEVKKIEKQIESGYDDAFGGSKSQKPMVKSFPKGGK